MLDMTGDGIYWVEHLFCPVLFLHVPAIGSFSQWVFPSLKSKRLACLDQKVAFVEARKNGGY